MMKKRCPWVEGKEEIYLKYHDEEWCVPKYDDNILFEMLILESFQAGLSWECVLNKREYFRKSYDYFDIDSLKNKELIKDENDYVFIPSDKLYVSNSILINFIGRINE